MDLSRLCVILVLATIPLAASAVHHTTKRQGASYFVLHVCANEIVQAAPVDSDMDDATLTLLGFGERLGAPLAVRRAAPRLLGQRVSLPPLRSTPYT